MRYITLIVATLVGVALTAPVESSTGTIDPYKRDTVKVTSNYLSQIDFNFDHATMLIVLFGNRLIVSVVAESMGPWIRQLPKHVRGRIIQGYIPCSRRQ
ncbi:hypothetical protein CcaCcLH18_09133 [Colletotrichum camelliae]|nr:hypothetical protein CcaCcLH18_09133 [Colletotrichum camelliae]